MSSKLNRNKKNNDGYLMGIDLGTSTLKVAIFDFSGKGIAFDSAEYQLSYPNKDLVENDIEKYWQTIVGLIKFTLMKMEDSPSKILALSLSSQGETIVPVDSKISPLRPAIVWLDGRSEEEAKQIAKDIDVDKLFEITGMPSSDPSWPAARIKWLMNNELDVFTKAYKFLLLEDYITFKLTGKIFGESTVYNTSYYYDITKLDYYDPMLDYLNISRSKLPEVLLPGTIVGNISKKASVVTGLNTSTQFVTGAMDQLAGAVGAGNIKSGIATETTGTAFAMVVTIDKPIIDLVCRIPCQLHVVKDKYCLLPYSMTGGIVLKWFKDNFYNFEEKKLKKLKRGKSIYNIMTKEAKNISPGCDGLIILPHLSGAFIPENNPDARGVFFSIGLNHRKSHFVRAILESIGFMLRNDLELFSKIDIKVDKLISLGGGAKSKFWCQIKADITGKEINILENSETAVLGAAIIAGVGVGVYNNYDRAVKNIVKLKEKFHPNNNLKEIYDKYFLKYKNLYENLKSSF